MAGYRRIRISYKSKKTISVPKDEWKIIYNTHEGIVTQEEFDIVQKMLNGNIRPRRTDTYKNVFAGIVKCADCGYAMRANSAHRRKRPDPIDCVQYSCSSYVRYGNKGCSMHSIEARTLQNIVLADIK